MIRAGIRLIAALLTVMVGAGAVSAQPIKERYASIVVNTETGEVLHAQNADELRYPASLTKMMTLYLLFDALDAGEIALDDEMYVSSRAAAQEPSKIYVRQGSTLKVEDAIYALTTKSANDAAVVIGERLGGTVEQFGKMMTEKARELGMTRTRFRNPNGLPDEAQVTTARDMATLGEALFRNHQDHYHYFQATEFRYGNVTYRNHNRLLANMDGVEGVDGIKTGYIRAAGYNLVTSAERDGVRIVATVLGGSTSRVRDAHMRDLVTHAFAAIEDNRDSGEMLVAGLSDSGTPLSQITSGPSTRTASPAALRADAQEEEQRIALASNELARPAEQGDASADRGVRIVFSEDAGAPSPEERAAPASNAVQPVVVRMPAEPDPDPEDRREPAVRNALREDDDLSSWQIQVGAYRDETTAMDRLAQLESMAITVLAGAHSRVEDATVEDARWFRARFAGLTEDQARAACSALTSYGDGCFAVSPQ